MESRVLSSKSIAPTLAQYFVCVKVNIDRPPAAAEKILQQVPGNTLPFIAYTTPDGKFITGTSGFRDENQLGTDLDIVLKHDALKPSAEDQKKLAALLEQASKDLNAGNYLAAVKAWRESTFIRGFSEDKKNLRRLADQAAEQGRTLLQEAEGLSKAGKHEEALAIVKKVQADFRGTSLDGPAQAALEALEKARPSKGPDTVVLKDGTSVSGKIVGRAEDVIMVQTGDGKFVKIPKEKIAEIKSEPKKATGP